VRGLGGELFDSPTGGIMPAKRRTFWVSRTTLGTAIYRRVYHRDKSCSSLSRSAGNLIEIKAFEPGVGGVIKHFFESVKHEFSLEPCSRCGQ